MMVKQAFILCAGFGTRLAPLSHHLPKALFPVVAEPALKILLRQLHKIGIEKFFINAHHLWNNITTAIGSSGFVPNGAAAKVIVEREKILGTGGGIANLFYAAGMPNETILIHNGDVVHDFDLISAYDVHRSSGAVATMLLRDNPKTNSVLYNGNRIVGFAHGQGLTYTGIMFAEQELFRTFPKDDFATLTDCIKPWLAQKLVYLYRSEKFWCDFGTLQSYIELHKKILIDGTLSIDGSGETIYISRSASVHPKAKLGGFVSIGDDAVVPEHCEILNCIVWNGTNVKQGKFINAIITPFGIVNP